jgi:hypothetical protein
MFIGIKLDSNKSTRPPVVVDELYWRRIKVGLNLLITTPSHKRIRMSIFGRAFCKSGGMGAKGLIGSIMTRSCGSPGTGGEYEEKGLG